MKKWERTEVCQSWTRIATVDEKGGFYSRDITFNGVIFNEYKTTVFAMGWESVEEFLKKKQKMIVIML